jgi:GNAT superfamily N-acetyltransferase
VDATTDLNDEPEVLPGLTIRRSEAGDTSAVIALDEQMTGLAKPDYWRDMFERYGARKNRFFLVAEMEGRFVGFILGEVRAWEFGSPPCGWIFALGVHPEHRVRGVGSRLFEAICRCIRETGVDKVRTMLARDDNLNLSFFRSQGMMGGPFIELEKALD